MIPFLIWILEDEWGGGAEGWNGQPSKEYQGMKRQSVFGLVRCTLAWPEWWETRWSRTFHALLKALNLCAIDRWCPEKVSNQGVLNKSVALWQWIMAWKMGTSTEPNLYHLINHTWFSTLLLGLNSGFSAQWSRIDQQHFLFFFFLLECCSAI